MVEAGRGARLSAESELAAIAERAAALTRSSSAAHREAGFALFVRLGRIRMALAREPRLAAFAFDLLAVSRIPEAPAQRRYTDDEVCAALKTSGSIKKAAALLGCSRRTLERRRNTILRHSLQCRMTLGISSADQMGTKQTRREPTP